MEQTESTATESSERTKPSQELVRPLSGRMIAGVAKGVADNFGISEWIPRVFFAVTAFMGGLGVALYAAGWAFIRSEDETESPAERFFSGASDSRSWLGIALIIVAGMIVLSEFTILAGEVIWAGAFLVVGLLLYLGYIPARNRASDNEASPSKEGVQRMTTTRDIDESVGDSPADGSPPLPPPPPPTPPDLPSAKPKETSILGRLTLGLAVIGMGLLAILDNFDTLPIDAEPFHFLALAITIVGAGLVVGAFAGRARWLILLLAFMIPTLIFSPYFGYDIDQNVNLQTHPTTFADVESEYEVNLGELVIDLTGLPWDGEEIELDAKVDAGRILLRLPADVGIVGTASVDIGQVHSPERINSGIGDPHLDWDDPGPNGTVFLDAHVSIGNIDIRRSTGG